MKDFTPCEHGSHPMGCIQCQLAVQPPATPQEQPVKGYTLQALSNYFGWGLRDDRAIWRFIHERESLLRLCQSLLGTEKSTAQTAELAIRECVEHLSAPPAVWQDKTADELRRIAAHIRTPGTVWAEDAIDEIARLLENRARQLSPLPSPPTPGEQERASGMVYAANTLERLLESEP